MLKSNRKIITAYRMEEVECKMKQLQDKWRSICQNKVYTPTKYMDNLNTNCNFNSMQRKSIDPMRKTISNFPVKFVARKTNTNQPKFNKQISEDRKKTPSIIQITLNSNNSDHLENVENQNKRFKIKIKVSARNSLEKIAVSNQKSTNATKINFKTNVKYQNKNKLTTCNKIPFQTDYGDATERIFRTKMDDEIELEQKALTDRLIEPFQAYSNNIFPKNNRTMEIEDIFEMQQRR